MSKRNAFIGLAVIAAIAVAVPAMGGGTGATPSVSAGKLNKKLKKLTQRVATLEATDPVPGPEGPEGPGGPQGPPGSPDTPSQVLDKLIQVDGPGSGLDADTLDGTTANDFGLVDGSNLGLSTAAAPQAFLSVPGVGELLADCNAGATATLAYRNPGINSQGVVTHHHEATTPFTQQDVAGGATTSAISLGPGSDLVTRVTYQTSAGQWDVFMSTTSDNSSCLFRGQVVR